MSTQPPTPNIGLVLPVPNSGQPWRTTDYNTLFTTIDTAFGADRNRLDGLEGSVDPAGIGAKGIPAGSTSARDAFWGIPSDDAGGLALQQKGARWFNTDLMREQVYYGKYDASTNPNGWISRGWHAPLSALTPIDGFSMPGVSGATVDSSGTIKLASVAAASTLTIDNVLWGLFEDYLLVMDLQYSASNYPNLDLLLLASGVKPSGNWAQFATTNIAGTTVTGGGPSPANTIPLAATGSQDAAHYDVQLNSPFKQVRASVRSDSNGGANVQRTTAYDLSAGATTAQYRGFALQLNGVTTTGTVNGAIRLYGTHRA
jgi:hypothetical protein